MLRGWRGKRRNETDWLADTDNYTHPGKVQDLRMCMQGMALRLPSRLISRRAP